MWFISSHSKPIHSIWHMCDYMHKCVMYVFLMFYGSNTLDRRGLFSWSTLGRKAVSIFHGIMPGLHSLAVFLLVAYTPPPLSRGSICSGCGLVPQADERGVGRRMLTGKTNRISLSVEKKNLRNRPCYLHLTHEQAALPSKTGFKTLEMVLGPPNRTWW